MARNRDEDYSDEPPRKRRDDDDEDDGARRRRDDDDRRGSQRGEDWNELARLSRADLKSIAWYQKAIIFCILGNLATIPVRLALSQMPPTLEVLSLLLLVGYYLAVSITATVFMFLLALELYGTGTGIMLGILTLIPCVGLIVLLVINSKATGVLKKKGVRVGLLGAKMSDLS